MPITHKTILVSPDPDAPTSLEAAAVEYLWDHPDVPPRYDLRPRWADPKKKDLIALDVPVDEEEDWGGET